MGLRPLGTFVKRGVRVVTAATAFSTYNHETRAKLCELRTGRMSLVRLQYEWELLWTRMTVDPSERRGYRRSDIVVVHYNSVREIIHRQFGSGISFGKMTYASEAAFLKAESDRGEIPEMVAGLEPKKAPLLVAVSRHDRRKRIMSYSCAGHSPQRGHSISRMSAQCRSTSRQPPLSR